MNKTTRNEYVPNYATPPGLVLEDYMAGAGMDIAALSAQSGLSESALAAILDARAPITDEVAAALERVFGRPAYLWNRHGRAVSAGPCPPERKTAASASRRGPCGPSPPSVCDFLVRRLGQGTGTRAKAAGVTPHRWIVNELPLRLQEGPANAGSCG